MDNNQYNKQCRTWIYFFEKGESIIKQSRTLFLAALTAVLISTATAPVAAANTVTISGGNGLIYFGSKPTVVSTTPTTVTTPTTISSGLPTALTAMEQQMVNLVNQERTKLGLKPLVVDMRLVKAARMKSQDMIDKKYTSHISPTYGSPFDMMKSMGITYKTAGENIAGASTVERAFTNLMNSPGHRANMMSPNYTKIGIGIIQGGPYGLMITQMFIG